MINFSVVNVYVLIPTIYFFVAILWALIIGMIRGFRKSMFLFFNAIIAFAICVVIFIVLINNSKTDENVVILINKFLGTNGLQNALEVNTSNKSMTDILIEYIPKQLSFGDGVRLILEDNGNYLYSIVNICYRLIIVIILSVLYYVFDFILFIIYLLFFRESKYKAKKGSNYNKHFIMGALVGGIRGFVTTIFVLSITGTLFFFISGGKGDKALEDYDFGNDSINQMYDDYNQISLYGSSGIYKILNVARNSDDIPYYLYACNLVFDVKVEDNVLGDVDANILTDSASYVRFSKDTYSLVMKYGHGEILNAIKNKESNDDITNAICNVLNNDEFQKEYDLLIDKFETSNYLHNMTFSLINSIVIHIDELDVNINENVKELIMILFKSDYYSKYIKEENDCLIKNDFTYIPASIRPSNLLTKDDIKNSLKLLIRCLGQINKNQSTLDVLSFIHDDVLPLLSNYSVLNTKNKSDFNPVFSRLYSYINGKYLINITQNEETSKQLPKLQLNIKDIDYVEELNNIIELSKNFLNLYVNNYTDNYNQLNNSNDFTDFLFDIFSTDNLKYDINIQDINSIESLLANSKLLGDVLESNFIFEKIQLGISNVVADYISPVGINYSGVDGETYKLFEALKLIASKKVNKEEVLKLVNGELTSSEKLQVLTNICNNTSNSSSLFESKLINSTIYQYIMQISDKKISFYIPQKYVSNYLLDVDQISLLIDKLDTVTSFAVPFMDKNGEYYNDLNYLLTSINNHPDIFESEIINGTIANMIIRTINYEDKLKKNIIIPNSYLNPEKWINNNEVLKIVSLSEFIDFNNLKEGRYIDVLQKLNNDNIEKLLNSDIMYYSISNYLLTYTNENFEIIIPSIYKEQDEVDVINKEELQKTIKSFSLIASDTSSSTVILKTLINNKDEVLKSMIVESSIVNYLYNMSNDPNSIILLNDELKNSALKEELDKYSTHNLWHNELEQFINGIDEILEVNEPSFDLSNNTYLQNEIKDKVNTLNNQSKKDNNKTKLDVLYNSTILKLNITKELDNNMNTLFVNEILNSVKEDNIYTKDEVKNLINSINTLNIEIDNISIDSLKNKILLLSKDDFNIIYNSKLISYKISEVLLINITSDICSHNFISYNNIGLLNSGILFDEGLNEYSYYIIKENEVYNLITSFNTLNLSFNDLSINFDTFIKLTDEQLNIIYNSCIIRGAVIKNLDEVINSDNLEFSNVSKIASKESDVIIANDNIYNLNEVKSLLHIFNDLSLNNEEEIKNFNFNDNLVNIYNSLNDIYSSILFRDYIYTFVNNSIKDNKNMTSSNPIITDNRCVENIAVENKTINLFEDNVLTLKYLTKEEVSYLLDFMIKLNINDLTSFKEDDLILSIDIINVITSSYILSATVSNYIINNDEIVKVKSVIEQIEEFDNTKKDRIIENELLNLLKGLNQGLDVSNVSSYTYINTIPTADKLNIIVESVLLRATVSSNLVFENGNIYVLDNPLYVSYDYKYEESGIYDLTKYDYFILSKQELIDLSNGLNILKSENGTYDFNLDYNLLFDLVSDIDKSYEALKSNVLKCIVSDYLYTTFVKGTYNYDNFRTTSSTVLIDETHGVYNLMLDSISNTYRFNPASKNKGLNLTNMTDVNELNLLTSDDIIAYVLYFKRLSSGVGA